MAEEEKGALENYIKKGLEKGFNIKYIKEVLIKHGHNPDDVETATNNIAGLKYPEELKPHLEEEGIYRQKPKSPVWLYVLVVVLFVIISLFTVNYFLDRSNIEKAQSQLEEIQEIGISVDDLSTTIKTQLALIKEKDLTIDEKAKIIEDQIDLIEEAQGKIEQQRVKINDLILDIMNRMIGRMSG